MQNTVFLKPSFWMRYAAVLAIALISVCSLTSCSSKKTIVNGLDEKEANEILVFLASKGIDASKAQSTEGGGGAQKAVLWDIVVDASRSTEAMALLNQAGLPRRRGQSLLGIFANVGLVPSEMQEKIRYQSGLAEQIASTIRKIDGVLDAEVQISIPETSPLDPLGEKAQKITASVYVKHSGVLDDPNVHLITKIKRLVAASVPGLDYDYVTVIGDRARYAGQSPSGGLSFMPEEEKEYVSLWTIVLAKESVGRFQILFFSFLMFILLFILALVWIGWKLYPLLQKHGGIKELFHIRPIALKKDALAEEEKEDKEKDVEKLQDQVEEKERPAEDDQGPGVT